MSLAVSSPRRVQVRFRLVHEFEPLAERLFCRVVQYVQKTNIFHGLLDATQVHHLIRMLDNPHHVEPSELLPWETNGYQRDGPPKVGHDRSMQRVAPVR